MVNKNKLFGHAADSPRKLFGSMLSNTVEILSGSNSGISRISLLKELNRAIRANASNTEKIKSMLLKINTNASKKYLSQINDLTNKTGR